MQDKYDVRLTGCGFLKKYVQVLFMHLIIRNLQYTVMVHLFLLSSLLMMDIWCDYFVVDDDKTQQTYPCVMRWGRKWDMCFGVMS